MGRPSMTAGISSLQRWGIQLAGAVGGGSSSVLPWPGAWYPVTLTNGSGSGMVLGSIGYIVANATVGKAASNATLAIARCTVMCLDTIANGGTGRFVFGGIVQGLAGLTAEADYWLGTTPGAYAAAPDLTAGDYLCRIGFALDAGRMQFTPSIPSQN